MTTHSEKHRNDVRLLLDTHITGIKTRFPKWGDDFEKRVKELQNNFEAYLERDDNIRSSGRYSPDGERQERRLNARAFKDGKLASARAATVTRLETRLQEDRAEAFKPKTATIDPVLLLLKELRLKELRDHLRTLDPLTLQVRIRQAVDDGASVELLEALEGAPVGFPIASATLVQEARIRIAEKNHPELGEFAQLRDAYSFALGVVEQALVAASGLSPVEIGMDPTVVADGRKPYVVSTGQEV